MGRTATPIAEKQSSPEQQRIQQMQYALDRIQKAQKALEDAEANLAKCKTERKVAQMEFDEINSKKRGRKPGSPKATSKEQRVA